MSLTTQSRAALQRVTDPHGFLELLTITGGGIAEPIRLVNDTRDCMSQGETFLRLPFKLVPPKQGAREVPRAQLRMDNVGRELVEELEALPLGAELEAKIQIVYRATPDVIDYEFTAPMSGIRADVLTITATIGPTELMRRPAVLVRYDPYTAPGLFPG